MPLHPVRSLAKTAEPNSTQATPISISINGFVRFGWETFKTRGWFFVAATVFYAIITWCASLASLIIISGTFLGVLFGKEIATLFTFLVSTILNSLIGMGWTAFFLKAHDDVVSATLSNFWHPQKFWSYLAACVLYTFIALVGFLFLIIPGIIALVTFMFAPYIVIDRGFGPIAALKESARITRGNRWRVLALITALGLVLAAGTLALVVGLLVAVPLTALATVHAYRRLSLAADKIEPRQPLSYGEKTLATLFFIMVIALLTSVVLDSLSSARESARASLQQQTTGAAPVR